MPALNRDHTVVNFGSLWRWKGWRKMNGVQCSASQFLLQYIKCVFFTAYGFSFHSRGECSCSEDDICARVWWAPWICQLCVFLSFSLRCHSFLCFSFIISLLNQVPRLLFSWHATHLSWLPLCPSFLSFHSPFPLPPYVLLFWSLSPCSPSSCSLFPPPPSLSYLPRRSHGSLVVRLLEGIPTPPPPPLEPLSRSLSSPSSSLASFFPLFPLLSPFFPPLFLMWKFWAIAGCFCGLVGMAFLEECLMLWL